MMHACGPPGEILQAMLNSVVAVVPEGGETVV